MIGIGLWIIAITAIAIPIIMARLQAEAKASEEHIKACTDPDYFKTRDDLLKENAELRAQLYIEKHKTEYR